MPVKSKWWDMSFAEVQQFIYDNNLSKKRAL